MFKTRKKQRINLIGLEGKRFIATAVESQQHCIYTLGLASDTHVTVSWGEEKNEKASYLLNHAENYFLNGDWKIIT